MELFYTITDVNVVPLSFEEEIKLLRSWKRTKNRNALETLVKNYILFTLKTVKRFYTALPEDDAVLLANRALLTAIDKFDAEREKVGRLCNLVPFCIKVEYRKFNRESELVKCPAKNEKEGRYVSLDKKCLEPESGDTVDNHDAGLRHEEAPEVDLDTLLGLEDPAIDKEILEERKEAVRKAITELDARQMSVISFVYYQGLDYAATARKMRPKCSREWVRQLHDKAIMALRDAMNKTEHV